VVFEKHDLEQLLSAVMPFAQQMLTKYGEFIPYAWTINNDGIYP